MITADALVRALTARIDGREIAALVDLAERGERGAILAALGRVPPGAKVDVPKLTEAMRREAAERHARQPKADPMAALNYFITIASRAQLTTLKRELERGTPVGEAVAAARASAGSTLTLTRRLLDDDDDDDGPAPRRPRVRLRRTRTDAPSPTSTPAKVEKPAHEARLGVRTSPSAASAARTFFGPKAFGDGDDRPRGCPHDVSAADWEKWRSPELPAWLIADDDDDDEEAVA